MSSGFTNRDHVVPFIAMILDLDVWFASQTTYVRPPRFNSRVKALEKIVENLSAKQARNPNSKYLNTALPRAKLAFRRAKKEEANLRPVDII